MADAADLKSVVRKDVRVRLPPSAPNAQFNCSTILNLPAVAPPPVTTKAQSFGRRHYFMGHTKSLTSAINLNCLSDAQHSNALTPSRCATVWQRADRGNLRLHPEATLRSLYNFSEDINAPENKSGSFVYTRSARRWTSRDCDCAPHRKAAREIENAIDTCWNKSAVCPVVSRRLNRRRRTHGDRIDRGRREQ